MKLFIQELYLERPQLCIDSIANFHYDALSLVTIPQQLLATNAIAKGIKNQYTQKWYHKDSLLH